MVYVRMCGSCQTVKDDAERRATVYNAALRELWEKVMIGHPEWKGEQAQVETLLKRLQEIIESDY